MASSGLLKLLHNGLQDERLLGVDPKIEEYQSVYVKGGRFTTEWYRVDFDNRPSFGSLARATLPRRGHLITRAFFVSTLPDILTQQNIARDWCLQNNKPFAGPIFGWTNSVGHACITQAQVTIASSAIDTLDGRLVEVLDEYHTPMEKVSVVNRLIGRKSNGFTSLQPDSNGKQIAVSLPFWFNRGDPSLALPIDAIGSDLVQIGVTINALQNLYYTDSRNPNGNNNPQITPPTDSTPSATSKNFTGDCYTSTETVQPPPLTPQANSGTTGGALWPMFGSRFYYEDPNGTLILDGKKVSLIPVGQMPQASELGIGDTYLLLEYVHLDKPEANRIRLGDLQYPIVQHYAINPFDTKGNPSARIPMRIPNPVREIYFMCHRQDADSLNCPFLATRDLMAVGAKQGPWWPDASWPVPSYSQTDSEPIQSFSLVYEGKLVRYATDSPALFRSILQAMEQRKTPFHWKYYYHLPFGTHSEFFGASQHMGEANFDKLTRVELNLDFKPVRGSNRTTDIPSYTVYVWAETYNILRVYGGRAGCLFNY